MPRRLYKSIYIVEGYESEIDAALGWLALEYPGRGFDYDIEWSAADGEGVDEIPPHEGDDQDG